MKTSPSGRAVLADREGRRLKAYKDSVGVWTIGIGHTSAAGPPKVTPGLTITNAECDAIFARDLVKYENAVSNAVKVPLAQHEYDALVSLCYNIGPGAFAGSTIVRMLNAGDRRAAGAAFSLWKKPAEIIPRRNAERAQFESGVYLARLTSGTKIATQPSRPGGAVVAAGGAAIATAAVQSGAPAWVGILIVLAAVGAAAFFIIKKKRK